MSVKQLRFASVLLAAIASIAAEAQGNITGRVIDEQSHPLPFANVVGTSYLCIRL
jgi:hypothetical protein